jgi:hypothetical protein
LDAANTSWNVEGLGGGKCGHDGGKSCGGELHFGRMCGSWLYFEILI